MVSLIEVVFFWWNAMTFCSSSMHDFRDDDGVYHGVRSSAKIHDFFCRRWRRRCFSIHDFRDDCVRSSAKYCATCKWLNFEPWPFRRIVKNVWRNNECLRSSFIIWICVCLFSHVSAHSNAKPCREMFVRACMHTNIVMQDYNVRVCAMRAMCPNPSQPVQLWTSDKLQESQWEGSLRGFGTRITIQRLKCKLNVLDFIQ